MAYNGVCRIQYIFGGAIVLLKPHYLCALKVLFKAEYVLYIRAAPAVYALVIVAHNAKVAVLSAQHFNKPVLRHVGILIFVHENILEAVLVLFKHLGALFKQLYRFHEQIVKVERVSGHKAALILLKHLFGYAVVAVVFLNISLNIQRLVFGI